MTTFTEAELATLEKIPELAAKLLDEGGRRMVERLMSGAREPDRIGRRVLAIHVESTEENERGKVLRFALRLGVSHPRASVMLSNAHATLFKVRNQKTLRPVVTTHEVTTECMRESKY